MKYNVTEIPNVKNQMYRNIIVKLEFFQQEKRKTKNKIV